MNGFLKSVTQWAEKVAKQRALSELMKMSDRVLEDAGFSRELLIQGAKAWPWRASEKTDSLPPLNSGSLGTTAFSEAAGKPIEHQIAA